METLPPRYSYFCIFSVDKCLGNHVASKIFIEIFKLKLAEIFKLKLDEICKLNWLKFLS